MANLYVAIPTEYTFGDYSSLSGESTLPNSRPRWIDHSSFSSAQAIGFVGYAYQGTGSTQTYYPLYAVWLTTGAGITTSNITSCWLQDSSSSAHVSSPSNYSDVTNVWEDAVSTPLKIIGNGGTYYASDVYEVSGYLFSGPTTYGHVPATNSWKTTTAGFTKYYTITVDQANLWTCVTYGLNTGYRYSISISGTSEANYDGIAIFTQSYSSGSRIDNMSAWAGHVISGSGTNFSDSKTIDVTSSTTLYIYFRTDSSGLTTGPSGYSEGEVVVSRGEFLKDDPGFELTGETTTSPTTAYIKGRAATTGTIKWGTSSSSMTNSVTVSSANTWVNVTSQTSVGSKTIYAYFVPSNTNSYNNSSTLSATAQMSAPSNITVTINGNGGSGGTSSKSVAPGASSWSISSVPSRTGFQLLGFWDTSNYSGGTKYLNASGSSVRSAPTSSMTIYARWEPIVNYSTTSSSYTVYCTTSNHEASTTEGSQQITISSGGSTSSGLTITYSENNKNWTVSSDGKKLTIPNGLSAGTYELEVSGTISASNSTHNTGISSDNQITVTIVAVTKYPNNSNPTKYKNTSGTTGTNVTYGTPTVSIGSGLTAGGGSATVSCSVPNTTTTWYWKYTNGTYSSQQSSSTAGSVSWSITTQTFTPSGGSASTITRFSKSSNTLSHSTMGTNAGTDYVKVTAVNDGDSSKTATDTESISNTSSTSTSTSYGTPTVEIGSGIWASGGHATVTCTVTNTVTTTTTYTSGASTSSDSSAAGTARWKITSNGNNRFSHPSSGGVSLSGVGTVYNSGTDVYHDSMTNNATTDTVVVTAYNINSTSKTATAQDVTTNSLSWKNPVYTQPGTGTSKTISLAAAGQTYTIVAAVTQKQEYTSGYVAQTVDLSNSVVYSVSTAKTGYSLDTSTHVVTVTNNESTSARNGFKVLLKCTGNANIVKNFTVTFNQSAGSQAYLNPVISGFTYDTFAASGATKTPTVTYYQDYAWNGVAGSGTRTSNTGGTLAYSTTGTLPSGFSVGSNFSTTGSVTWANNISTSTRDAKSNLKVTVTVGGLTSSAYTCTACSQSAGAMVYANPSITGFSYADFAAGGATKSPTVTYSQTYTWNGVSGTGGTVTSGGTLAYATTGTLPSGFSVASNYSTSGSTTWASRTTTVGDARDAKSNLTVTVTLNGKSSTAYTCTSCKQAANAVTALALAVGSNTINYNGTTTCTATATYTSGSTLDVSGNSGTTYSTSPTGVVTVTK